MPDVHARLSPSGASRWSVCTASIPHVESLGLPDEKNAYSEKGERDHLTMYRALTSPPGVVTLDPQQEVAYKWFVDEVRGHDYTFWYEKEVKLSYRGLKTFGTADVIGYEEALRILLVWDWKFGVGVKVEAFKNTQLLIYAAAACQTVLSREQRENLTAVKMVIAQPRLFSGPHCPSSIEPDYQAILDILWDRKIPHAAWAIEEGHTEFKPSASVCRFCRARKAGACQYAVDPASVRHNVSNPDERARKFAEVPITPSEQSGWDNVPDDKEDDTPLTGPRPHLKLRRVRENVY